jgi:hypothetical protein
MKFLKNPCCIDYPWKSAGTLKVSYPKEGWFKTSEIFSECFPIWCLYMRKILDQNSEV